jgi:hypothetical protein
MPNLRNSATLAVPGDDAVFMQNLDAAKRKKDK